MANNTTNISFQGYGYSKIRHSAMDVFKQINITLEKQGEISFDELTNIVQKKANTKSLSVKHIDLIKQTTPELSNDKFNIIGLFLPAYNNNGKPIIFTEDIRSWDTESKLTFIHEFFHAIQSLKRKDKATQKALNIGTTFPEFHNKLFEGLAGKINSTKKFPKNFIKKYTSTFIINWLDSKNLPIDNNKTLYIKKLMEAATKEKEANSIENEISRMIGNAEDAQEYSDLAYTYRIIVLELKKHLKAKMKILAQVADSTN